MKKMMKYITAAFVAIVAVSCVEEMETGVPQGAKKMVDVTFGVNIADEDITRTSLGVENDAPAVLWTKGDKVAVWDGTQINEFTLVSGEGTSSAMFTGQVTEGATEYCVIYPYECVVEYSKYASGSHQFKVTLPVEQRTPVNGFCEECNISAGYTTDLESGITMYNRVGYLKIEIKGKGIASVTVFDNANAVISGSLTTYISSTNGKGYSNGRSDKLQSNEIILLPQVGETELSEGVYYLTYRAGNKFANGMSVKFENTDGEVAYYTSMSANSTATVNTTLNLGVADAANMASKWKKLEEVELSFASSNWPFAEELADDAVSIDGTYTHMTNGMNFYVKSTNGVDSKGMKVASGDYIELPAVAGKRLKEVILTGTVTAGVYDESGSNVSGSDVYVRSEGTYTYFLPSSELNTKYRLVASDSGRFTDIKLRYVGEDVADISAVSVEAVNSFTGFTVTGEVQGTGLDAATWGIQYGTVEGEWTNEITGNGGKINKLVEVPAGTYYVRTWASEDGGLTKIYSASVTVTVKAFDGTVTFDFLPQSALNNITPIGTSEGNDAFGDYSVYYEKDRTITGEDYFTYNDGGTIYPFAIYSCWDAANEVRTAMTYRVCSNSLGLRNASGGNSAVKFYYMSIPVIAGWKLTGVRYFSHQVKRGISVRNAPKSDATSYGSASKDLTGADTAVADTLYEYFIDLSSKDLSDETQCFLSIQSNGYHRKFIFEYAQVN